MKHLLNLILAGVALMVFIFLPVRALAASDNLLDAACGDQSSPQYNSPVCQDARNQAGKSNNPNPVADLAQKAVNLVAVLAGIAAVILIIIGGIQYTTAGGAPAGQRAGDSPTKAKNARATILNAVIGLVVIALAWSIISFVIQKVVK